MIQFAAPILALGLVSPGFLAAGALLVAVPILIHILNRRRFKTVTWAAMEYLLRAMRKNRRRLKFEQWLLLATRCAVLVLLGLALARPLGCESSSLATIGGRTGMSVFVIDNSYSMGYRVNRGDAVTHLDAAKVLAKAMIDRLSPGGEAVAVVTAASPATAVIARPGYDLSAAKAAIDRIEQSAGGTDMAGALQLALQIGREAERQPNKNLHLLSDSTSSAWRKEAQAEAIKQAAQELAKVYRVSHHNLAQGLTQWNAAVLSVKPNANLVTNKFLTTFT